MISFGRILAKRLLSAAVLFISSLWVLPVSGAPDFPSVEINPPSSMATTGMPQPLHHGISVFIKPISDPSLTGFEVQLKPVKPEAKDFPFPPWSLYSKELQPYDGRLINIPYRNGIYALKGDETYCIRIRAVYGETVTPWAEQCGVKVDPGVATQGASDSEDADQDGLSDKNEYLAGADPLEKDTDQDGILDGQDPNISIVVMGPKGDPALVVKNPVIDFGEGDFFGGRPNQHSAIELVAVGGASVTISQIEVLDGKQPGASEYFKIGTYPKPIKAAAPYNDVHIPISFFPKKRGGFTVQIKVTTDPPQPLSAIVASGIGVEIPDCSITPMSLDFGTVAVNDQETLIQEVTFANKPPPGETSPANIDTPWSFTLAATIADVAPGIRSFTLQKGEEIKIPVLFKHEKVGQIDGHLVVESAHCGKQWIPVKGMVTEPK